MAHPTRPSTATSAFLPLVHTSNAPDTASQFAAEALNADAQADAIRILRTTEKNKRKPNPTVCSALLEAVVNANQHARKMYVLARDFGSLPIAWHGTTCFSTAHNGGAA